MNRCVGSKSYCMSGCSLDVILLFSRQTLIVSKIAMANSIDRIINDPYHLIFLPRSWNVNMF